MSDLVRKGAGLMTVMRFTQDVTEAFRQMSFELDPPEVWIPTMDWVYSVIPVVEWTELGDVLVQSKVIFMLEVGLYIVTLEAGITQPHTEDSASDWQARHFDGVFLSPDEIAEVESWDLVDLLRREGLLGRWVDV